MDISRLADLRFLRIAEVFPELAQCGHAAIDADLLDRRSVTSLRRRQCTTWADLQELTIGDLWSIKYAGRLTVERILGAAREQASRLSGGAVAWAPHAGGQSAQAPRVDGGFKTPSPQQRAVEVFVDMFTQWAADARGAVTIGDLLALLPEPLPDDVADARAKVVGLSIGDVVPGRRDADTSSGMIVEFLKFMGSDARFVVERHIADPVGRAPTLESVAERTGITRERVRQIVKRGVDQAEARRRSEVFRLLVWRANDLSGTLGTACRVDSPSAVAAIAHASRGFDDPDGCSAEEFMLWFAGEYRTDDGWWVSRADRLDTVKRAIRDALQSDWLLERDELLERVVGAGVVVDVTDEDLALLTGWRCIDDLWWVRWDGTVGDKAERVFRLALRAIHPAEMNALIGDGHAVSSVQNVLSSDGRFMRVSMEMDYALSEWGWEEYSTTAQEIAERIERAGGVARLEDVVIELLNQFGLKERTVRTFAASPAFVVEDGMIRMRAEHEEIPVNDRIASAKGLFVDAAGRVIFHVLVDGDVLRGSGRSIPNPLSVAVGVRPGGMRDFAVGGPGRIRVTWPMTTTIGARIGSMRAVVEDLGARQGDMLRLVFDVVAETVRGSLVSGASLSDLTGLDLEAGSEAWGLADAIGVDVGEVRAVLHDRGDEAVAMLIPVPRVSPGLDDALARLDGLLG